MKKIPYPSQFYNEKINKVEISQNSKLLAISSLLIYIICIVGFGLLMYDGMSQVTIIQKVKVSLSTESGYSCNSLKVPKLKGFDCGMHESIKTNTLKADCPNESGFYYALGINSLGDIYFANKTELERLMEPAFKILFNATNEESINITFSSTGTLMAERYYYNRDLLVKGSKIGYFTANFGYGYPGTNQIKCRKTMKKELMESVRKQQVHYC